MKKMILFLICLAMASSMKAENSMKCRGIVYDVGLQFNPGFYSVDSFNVDQVRYDFSIISNILHVNTVRIEGEDIGRLVAASKIARDYGLRVFFNPWLMGADEEATVRYMKRAAKAAEELREEGVDVVFVAGCEYSLFSRGIFEGNSINERIMAMATMAREGNKDCLYIGDEIIHVTDSYLEAFNGYVLRMQGMTK